MLPSVYKKKNKKHFGSSPSRLTLLSTIIGALLSNAYASTSSEKIDLNGKEQIETSDIDIDTGVKIGKNGYAVSVQNSGKLTTEGNVKLSTAGKNAFAISVSNNSSLTITNGASIATSGKNATGINIENSNGLIEGGNIITSGDNARGVVISGENSQFSINNSIITTQGENSNAFLWGARGISAENKGSVSVNNTQIKTEGSEAFGVFTSSGASVELTDTKITTSGKNAYGLRSDGMNSTITASKGLQIVTSGNLAHAVSSLNNGHINLGTGASIETKGEQADTIQITGNNGGTLTGDSVSIQTTGYAAKGIYVAAISPSDSSPESHAVLTGSSTIYTSGDDSIAIWGHGKNAHIDVEKVAINTIGNYAYGINAQNNATVNASTAQITTGGSRSYGVVANDGGKITLGSGSSITTSGDYSHGLWASDSNTVIQGENISVHTSGNGADSVVATDNGKAEFSQKDGVIISEKGANFSASGGTIVATLDGSQIINSGTFILSASNNTGSGGNISVTTKNVSFNGDIRADEKSSANLSLENSRWTGSASNGGTVNLDENSIWKMAGNSDIAQLSNNGSVYLGHNAQNTLTINGDYTSKNGHIYFSGILGDDDSSVDKLIVKGNTDGKTFVTVKDIGGVGAQTLNGIEIIHVDGQSNGEFIQSNRIAAGAYDYTLGRGQGSNSGNWYLTSGKNTPEPTPTPDPDSKPEPAPGGYDNDLRPEAGSYTANMAAVNTMFVTRLHERLGPMQYTDIMTGETKNTSMWMRHEGGHNRWRDGTGQLKTQGNRYVVQLGGDIAQWGWGETDRWHLGVMAGYGNDHNNTDSVRTGYRSKGSVNGYSTGLYATWFANDETHNGAYLDTWAQYGWFDNHVKGDGLPGESWKSKGLTASLETGYTWKAGEFSGSHGSLNEWYVQPQAQVVWMGVKADEHRESNGTRVENTGDGNVRTRLGVKTWIKGHNRMDDGKSREFRPFVEVNWLHNTREFGTRMNGVTVHQDGARNIGEVKAGVEGQINDRLNLWGNVGVQAGDKGYSDTSAMLGVKYTF
ncbi:TPA: autotransporter outer membrane beta-barrel domain-containing protein [Escherichia coli]